MCWGFPCSLVCRPRFASGRARMTALGSTLLKEGAGASLRTASGAVLLVSEQFVLAEPINTEVPRIRGSSPSAEMPGSTSRRAARAAVVKPATQEGRR